MKFNLARGNIHIHSNLSDGTSSIEEIARDAKKAGLDFIVINDHEHLKGKDLGLEGFYDDTMVLIGQEVNRLQNNYLVLGLDEVIGNDEEDPEKIAKEVKGKGGIGFIAHPFEDGSPLVNNGRTYPWTDFNIDGFDGMEVSNYSSEWRDGAQTILHAVYANFIDDLAFMDPPNRHCLAKWKELTKRKKVTGIIGSDAHAPIFRVGPFSFKVLSYKYLFNSGNNYVYLERPLKWYKDRHGLKEGFERAKKVLIKALKAGNVIISYDRVGKGDDLELYLQDLKNDRFYFPGDVTPPGKYLLIAGFTKKGKNKLAKLNLESEDGSVTTFALPYRDKISLNRGRYIFSISHPKLEYWIIANPIYVWH